MFLLILIINFKKGYKLKENFKNNEYNIFYINLDKRKDRKKSIENELNKVKNNINNVNIKRIKAVEDKKNGEIGCGKSHIKSLILAKKMNLEYVIIAEDDIIIKDELIKKSFDLIEKIQNWDVIILSGHGEKEKLNNMYSKAKKIQTTGLYVINKKYYDKLINNFNESIINMDNLRNNNQDINGPKWAIDQNWKKLQKKDNWYILNNNLGYQKENYSDIEKKKINYSKFLN